ncbi:MAG TPA: class I SAM-dependent methyltransferase [Candidatus Binataceae bacterium]|nr:class I SAM-dependent methyltransferase [Candidatus Binataceae bacterium]
MAAKYLFGDSDLAAHRLQLLARVFDSSTRAFVRAAAGEVKPALAIDLGCGPGFTTHLLAEELGCEKVIGFDASRHFIDLACARASSRVSFELHDVLNVPFGCGAADVLFCRFLLTHIRDPHEAIARWASQLRPAGLLMLEEVEAIDARVLVFNEYMRIVAAMLESESHRLYAGAIVREMRPELLKLVRSDLRQVPVTNVDAAAMFALNLRAWRDSQFIRANYPVDLITKLGRELEQIARSDSRQSDIQWLMRQAVFIAEPRDPQAAS